MTGRRAGKDGLWRREKKNPMVDAVKLASNMGHPRGDDYFWPTTTIMKVSGLTLGRAPGVAAGSVSAAAR